MAHLSLTVVLLCLASVHAAPAPEPSHPKFAFVKNSAFGAGLAGKAGKGHGMVESNPLVETPIEAPIDTGDNIPDVVLLDNVNAGGSYASDGNVACGVVKNNEFDDNSKEEQPQSHEPSNRKFSLAKDSSVGLGVARQKSKALGVAESNKIGKKRGKGQAEKGNNVSDVAVLDKVNTGNAFASSGSAALGVVKNNRFANDPIKGDDVPFMGCN